jgi:hypothetical protein
MGAQISWAGPSKTALQRARSSGFASSLAVELWDVRRLARNVRGRAGNQPRHGPHPHRAPLPSWPAPAEISPQERPALPSQRFPANPSCGPLNSSSAQAYRPAMSRLINQLSPNPRLQRTRVCPAGGRSPLSRKPLGVR